MILISDIRQQTMILGVRFPHAHRSFFVVVCASTFLACLAVPACAQELSLQKSNTTENLRGVSVVSDKVAWASGTHGTYLRTLDGGSTWVAAQVPGTAELDFRDVEAFSPELAYLLSIGAGKLSRIYKTTDGGKNWALQFTNANPKAFFDCMAFWDEEHGLAISDPVGKEFILIATDDGGTHWSELFPKKMPQAFEGEGAFAASGSCLTVHGDRDAWFASGGSSARVFHSTDRGKTWNVAETPIVHGNASSGIFSITFRDEKHGVAAGGDYKLPEMEGPNLAFTDDGGVTWKLSDLSPQPFFSAVALDPKDVGRVLAVGPSHAADAPAIQGKEWPKLWNVSLNAISFSASGDAFAVGPLGTIVKISHP
jgi:photosystem II stability/assembly factor-like uncharacterized protein